MAGCRWCLELPLQWHYGNGRLARKAEEDGHLQNVSGSPGAAGRRVADPAKCLISAWRKQGFPPAEDLLPALHSLSLSLCLSLAASVRPHTPAYVHFITYSNNRLTIRSCSGELRQGMSSFFFSVMFFFPRRCAVYVYEAVHCEGSLFWEYLKVPSSGQRAKKNQFLHHSITNNTKLYIWDSKLMNKISVFSSVAFPSTVSRADQLKRTIRASNHAGKIFRQWLLDQRLVNLCFSFTKVRTKYFIYCLTTRRWNKALTSFGQNSAVDSLLK